MRDRSRLLGQNGWCPIQDRRQIYNYTRHPSNTTVRTKDIVSHRYSFPRTDNNVMFRPIRSWYEIQLDFIPSTLHSILSRQDLGGSSRLGILFGSLLSLTCNRKILTRKHLIRYLRIRTSYLGSTQLRLLGARIKFIAL